MKISRLITIIALASTLTIAWADMAQDRAEYVQKAMRMGLIKKIDYPGGKLPHVWVTPYLLSQDYDAKRIILGVVFGHAFGGSTDNNNLMIIRHSISGKRIGTFSTSGLHLD